MCVAKQVQEDLLELDTIARDGREIVGEFRLKNNPVSLKLTRRERITSRVASFRSTSSLVGSLLVNWARNRTITSDARSASRIVRCAVSRAPSMFGRSAASRLRPC